MRDEILLYETNSHERVYHFREPLAYKLVDGFYQHEWKSKASISIVCDNCMITIHDVLICISEEFDSTYRIYAESPDNKLASGAIHFKNELRNMIDWIEEKKIRRNLNERR